MRKNGDKVRYNYIFNLIYQAINILVQVVLLRYLAIVIGSEGIGIQSYTNSIVTYFTMILALGVNWYGQKEIARKMEDKTELSKCFWELMALKLIWSLAVLPFYVIVIILGGEYRIYYIASSFMLAATIVDISWFYQGIERFDIVALRNSLIKLLGMFLVILCVKEKDDVLKYILILSLSNMLGNFSIWVKIHKDVLPFWKAGFEFKKIADHFKDSFRYFVPTIAITVYSTLDRTMIGFICKRPEENGFYEQAIQVSNMLKIVVLSYNSVMMSRMTLVMAQKKKTEVKELFEGSLEFILLISWPIILGVAALARDFCFIYFGLDYNEIADILLCFSPLTLIVGLSNIVETHIVTPANQRSLGNRIVIQGLIANVILNSLFIPLWNGIGAALASVLSEILVTIQYVRRYPEFITWKKIASVGFKKSIAGVIMFLVIMVVKHYLPVSVAVLCMEVAVGAVLYFLTLYLLRDQFIINKVRLIKEKVGKRRDGE